MHACTDAYMQACKHAQLHTSVLVCSSYVTPHLSQFILASSRSCMHHPACLHASHCPRPTKRWRVPAAICFWLPVTRPTPGAPEYTYAQQHAKPQTPAAGRGNEGQTERRKDTGHAQTHATGRGSGGDGERERGMEREGEGGSERGGSGGEGSGKEKAIFRNVACRRLRARD